jgi:hypothetical protein
MLRSLVCLQAALPAIAITNFDTTKCALNFGSFADGSLDAVVYTWSATKRCSTTYQGTSQSFPGVACVEDVASSIQSILGVLDNMIAMLKGCHIVKKKVPMMTRCIGAVTDLVANTAGLVAASAKVTDECSPGAPAAEVNNRFTPLGYCLAQIGNSMKGLLASTVTLSQLAKKQCQGQQCVGHILALIDIASKFGASVASAFDRCDQSQIGGIGSRNQPAMCAADIFSVIGSLAGLADKGYAVAQACTVPPGASAAYPRLYEGGPILPLADSGTGNSMTIVFAVALPLTAVVSVFFGMRLARAQRTNVHLSVEEGPLE